MWDFVSTWIARVLAAWLAGFATWLLVHYGIVISAEEQRAFTEHLVGIIIPLLVTLYSILHKLLDKHFNPGDAASSHIAVKEQREAAQLRGP